PGVVLGTKASLEFLIENGKFHLHRFHENSRALRAYFIREIREEFEVVQSASNEMNRSNFVAVHPRSGYRWKERSVKEFWEKIRDDGMRRPVIVAILIVLHLISLQDDTLKDIAQRNVHRLARKRQSENGGRRMVQLGAASAKSQQLLTRNLRR